MAPSRGSTTTTAAGKATARGGGLSAAGKSTESGEARETAVGEGRGADDDGGDRLRYAASIKHD